MKYSDGSQGKGDVYHFLTCWKLCVSCACHGDVTSSKVIVALEVIAALANKLLLTS